MSGCWKKLTDDRKKVGVRELDGEKVGGF